MAKIYKCIVCLTTFLFTHSAAAVIVEGSFSGRFWDTWSTNTELSPQADFWAVETGWAMPFEGSFWYDTALAGAPVLIAGDDFEEANYSSAHNWLHGTLTVNGQKITMTTGGPSDPVSSTRLDRISLGRHVNEYGEQEELFAFDAGDNYYSASSGRGIGFIASPYYQPVSFLNDLSLIQNFSLDGHVRGNVEYLGYMQFAEWGVVDGVMYEGFLSGEINKFDIHVRVPEPSSLFLFLCVLPLLIWRNRLIETVLSRSALT